VDARIEVLLHLIAKLLLFAYPTQGTDIRFMV